MSAISEIMTMRNPVNYTDESVNIQYSDFDVDENEIMADRTKFKGCGLSQVEVWNAIVAGVALDLAFGRTNRIYFNH